MERACDWRDADPDPVTRSEMAAAIERADPDELSALMLPGLEFGTAGIRGPVGAGPNRMNRLLVRQTAAGLARVLLREDPPELRSVGVVVGRDARHGSAEFARDVVDVVTGHGIPVRYFDDPVPTPLVAFALGHLGAAAGVVVTASHNPAADNGIKVYWSDGAQIVPPVDQRISDAIASIRTDERSVVASGTNPATATRLGGATSDEAVVVAYVDAALSLAEPRDRRVPIALTSMHGVGADLVERVLTSAGHDVAVVASQREPDPDFPTVVFPNPEEPGALDELVDLARDRGCALAIANDPDADRMALAAPEADGRWRALTGDETGALLARHLLGRTDGVGDRLLATTVVSSRLVARMAESAGAHFAETLTGFKWLCRPGIENPGWHQVLLYEEALGYAIGPRARDKDGITAALVAADLAAVLDEAGRTVWDELDDLARIHGAHVTRNGSIRVEAVRAAAVVATIERWSTSPPSAIGGQAVDVVDVPASDVVRFVLGDATRVVVRPSGTEPKVKYYCEAVDRVVDDVEAARSRCRERLDRIVPDLERLLTVEE